MIIPLPSVSDHMKASHHVPLIEKTPTRLIWSRKLSGTRINHSSDENNGTARVVADDE